MTEKGFEEKHEENLYFTLRGCEMKGYYKVPQTVINAIYNWSGLCTDPCETEDYYKNPRAMFVALDLIYMLLDELLKSDQFYEKWHGEFKPEWALKKISELS